MLGYTESSCEADACYEVFVTAWYASVLADQSPADTEKLLLLTPGTEYFYTKRSTTVQRTRKNIVVNIF